MQKYIAEFIGTFALAFVVTTLVAQQSSATPFIAMLTLGLFVYTIGPLSGCHINPAITLGILALGKITPKDAVLYIVAQCAGAFFFAFGVAAVVHEKVPSAMNGVVIGGSLLLGIMIASSSSLGVLNPAVAIALGVASLPYLLGPVVGAALGMYAYRTLWTKIS